MPTTVIKPGDSESLIGIDPELLQQVDAGWRHRLSLYSGRALSDTALASEQAYRSGLMASLAQSVTPGTAQGLIASLDLSGKDPVLQVTPGYGFCATGEDITLPRLISAALKDLPVVDSVTAAVLGNFDSFSHDTANQDFVLIPMLQPVSGQATAAEIDTGSGPIEVSGDFAASCDRDPEEYAFEDWQTVDGAILVLGAWPKQPDSLKLPVRAPDETWRNRLAYTIFNAELQLDADGFLPWMRVGIPLGLLGFTTDWKPLFLDHNVLVRPGGLARRAYLQPFGTDILRVSPNIGDARLFQLLEQVAGSTKLTSLASEFVTLPPSGILPVGAVDLQNRKNLWFPDAWTLHAGPIHAEEIETAILSSIDCAPLDVTKPEEINILVPLSDAVYDPNVLVTETVAPEFQQEIDKATAARNLVLQHRKDLQLKRNVLRQALALTPIDLDAGLTDVEKAARDVAGFTPVPEEAFGTVSNAGVLVSSAISDIKTKAVAPSPVPLFTAADLTILDSNGLQQFMDTVNARISKADDLINTAFLRSQTDIYRYRQHVLGAADATRLAVSPILANIAIGDSAAATASNLHDYLTSTLNSRPLTAVVPSAPPPAAASTNTTNATNTFSRIQLASASSTLVNSRVFTLQKSSATLTKFGQGSATRFDLTDTPQFNKAFQDSTTVSSNPGIIAVTPPTPIVSEIQDASPLVGAELNLRTLTVADRLKQSPSQEALFYSVANRNDVFARLLDDLEITVDDIQFFVHVADAQGQVSVQAHKIGDLRTPATRATVLGQVQQGGLVANADEAAVFNAGIRTLEQHSLMLRALEARVAEYRNFVMFCGNMLLSIQTSAGDITNRLTQLDNDLSEQRQNLGFVSALMADEVVRVNGVNQTRSSILQAVTLIAFARPRTLKTESNVPTRQLVPGNVVSPVPQCLSQVQTIPPELREMAGLIRECPLRWFPEIEVLLDQLDRLNHLRDLAAAVQSRAYQQLQTQPRQSSAYSHPGVYGRAIGAAFETQQNVMRQYMTERSRFEPSLYYNRSWTEQRQVIGYYAAIADLLAAEAVHLEIANTTARVIQQVGGVAACLYDRVSRTPPVDRLEWAEFLRGPGSTAPLRNLSELPRWNEQPYLDRQQMQLIVDWMFARIDTSDATAVNFMSDIIRVAVLLASHAPVNEILAGEVSSRTLPILNTVFTLNSSSIRVARGMPVQLYQAGELTAQATVEDLDGETVVARYTNIYKPNVFIEAGAQAHFLNEPSQNVAYAKTYTAIRK